jgi:hypothetical protein
MFTGKDSGAYVWLDDCGNDGQINVNFRWDNDLADLRERSVMTVDQAEERGRPLLAAVRVARTRRGVRPSQVGIKTPPTCA